ncbi:VOC family protein [Flexibacterium corallicola]|uniref:VOC family protein n=1 Tax=Flexibacterium corallicola TaxID=3037259 RepID=UPI00286F6A52|nr:VOC family protein [Pseudovibrio sp. M1P-2-3]
MIPQRLSLVTLGVSDLAKSRQFYEAWGWKVHARSGEDIIFYQLNGMVLGLYPLGELAKDMTVSKDSLGTGMVTLALNFGSEAEVGAAYGTALLAGASALKPPQKVFWGGYSGYVRDLDGHPWELAYNPFWKLEDDGNLTLPPRC